MIDFVNVVPELGSLCGLSYNNRMLMLRVEL